MSEDDRIGTRERTRATVAGQDGWGTYGNAGEHRRYKTPSRPGSRRRCTCGCGGRAAFLGRANGVALMTGCELRVTRWVRDGSAGA